jgi:hypothetical protein
MERPDREMSDEETASARRVKFFSAHDLAAGWYLERVADVLDAFSADKPLASTNDAIEVHNVLRYLENEIFPRGYSSLEIESAKTKIPPMRSSVAKYFSSIEDDTCVHLIADVNFEYHADLLDLLAWSKAFERCSATAMLAALDHAELGLSTLLCCKTLVDSYDREIRARILSHPRNAEHLIRTRLEKDPPGGVFLPPSLMPADMRQLLERYIRAPDANTNYLALVATAKPDTRIGIDSKLKLLARRRHAEIVNAFFEKEVGMRTGFRVATSDTQAEAVRVEIDRTDGWTSSVIISSQWLEATTDYASILNNFQHLFSFADYQALLTLPSYPVHLGVMERTFRTVGATDYQTGAAFQAVDSTTLLETLMYFHYLRERDIELEDVTSWFFRDYLVEEFGARNFSFAASNPGSPYLERVRHLFAEMDSVVTQFSLFVKEGELDRELLAISPEIVRYKEIPSLVPDKYVCAGPSSELVGVIHALFSDQSALTYISDTLRGTSLIDLLSRHKVTYADFHEYQRGSIDDLCRLGVLKLTDGRVKLASPALVLVLKPLYETQAANYHRLPATAQTATASMADRDWAVFRSALLTEAEADYFNYFLNSVQFHNGPRLRNKYQHGTQEDDRGENGHFHTYITALRLLICLVIKINDDFCIAATQTSGDGPVPQHVTPTDSRTTLLAGGAPETVLEPH